MRIIDPQSAVLSNIEVLAYLTANPPRRPPNPPPNSRHWVPSPDLRDHNTVVKEIHNYVSRLSPHLQSYPQYTHIPLAELEAQAQAHANLHNTSNSNSNSNKDTGSAAPPTLLPPKLLNKPTPVDRALRDLVTRLKPYGLTKGEVLMIVNLGIGLMPAAAAEEGEEEGETEEYEEEVVEEEGGAEEEGEQPEEMEVDGGATNGEQDAAGAGGENGEAGSGELAEEDYGAMALLDTVIEEREERLSEADVAGILTIIRETLGGGAAAAAAS
ncbi:uncharacterized protein BO95DRAFT_439499 [Aspergillus brunneoviolaceus CBS 621.78]|uniref:Uncharacterized protein n=1 Tax=Aspergillus brunneoviolaceus CBS 621.78 TaxID=1450534 RepID=A0ACD1GIZ9_9EURO|nr:hypothetical protein BO95DRAFT_439499 [Aspergillus brunneoviolaceus CBS 621.78]RAH49227.1 hypothetical protein BO95DRAFT_439499 [Aspergillus brunneoviolaceus CBS 621.78]